MANKFQFAVYSGGLVTQKLLALILVPFVASELTVADFGEVQVLISVSGLITLLITSGLDEVLIRTAAKTPNKIAVTTDTFFACVSKNALYFTIVSLSLWWLGFVDKRVVFATALGIAMVIHLAAVKIFRVLKLLKFFVLSAYIFPIAYLILVLVSIKVFGGSFMSYFIGACAAAVFCSALGAYTIRRMNDSFFDQESIPLKLRSFYREGFPVLLHQVFGWGFFNFLLIIWAWTFGDVAAGNLYISYFPALAFNFFAYVVLWNFQANLFTRMAQNKRTSILVLGTLLLLITGAGGVAFVGSDLVFLFFDNKYVFEAHVFLYVLAGHLFHSIAGMFTYFFYYDDNITDKLAVTTVFFAVIHVVAVSFAALFGSQQIMLAVFAGVAACLAISRGLLVSFARKRAEA